MIEAHVANFSFYSLLCEEYGLVTICEEKEDIEA